MSDITNYPNGVSSFGVPVLPNQVSQYVSVVGKVFWVDSNTGTTAGAGTYESPRATVFGTNGALSLCTANNYDLVICKPRHAETLTAVGTLSKATTQIVGMRVGNLFPTFTVNGAVDLFSFTAANQLLASVEMAIVTTDAATAFVNFAAAKCRVVNCKGIPSATSVNVVDCFTFASGADDCVLEGTELNNTTVAVNSFLSLEAAVARVKILNNKWIGDCATAGCIDAATATFLTFNGNHVQTIGTNIPAVVFDSNPTGTANGNKMYGTDATIANNINWGSALLIGDNYVRGGTGSAVSATNISPAQDT